MRINYRRLYGLLAALLWLMMLGAAGALEKSAHSDAAVWPLALTFIGMTVCACRAMH